MALPARNWQPSGALEGTAQAWPDALGKGHMNATVVQDPIRMGYLAVKALVDHLWQTCVTAMMHHRRYRRSPATLASTPVTQPAAPNPTPQEMAL